MGHKKIIALELKITVDWGEHKEESMQWTWFDWLLSNDKSCCYDMALIMTAGDIIDLDSVCWGLGFACTLLAVSLGMNQSLRVSLVRGVV